MQRFLISGLDLRIDAAIRPKQGQTVHRFSISSPDLRIDAAIRSKQGQSVHRFLISSPDLRIDAAKRSKQWQSLQPKGWSNVPRTGNAGWADSDAERRPCPQADSAAETVKPPQADSDAGTHSSRHKKKSPDSSLNRDSRSAAATYSPTWCSSTIGASELNFSVRDGKRWILTAITAAI